MSRKSKRFDAACASCTGQGKVDRSHRGIEPLSDKPGRSALGGNPSGADISSGMAGVPFRIRQSADLSVAVTAQRKTNPLTEALLAAGRRLRAETGRLSFRLPVSHVYNPLVYAWTPYEAYLQKFSGTRKRIVFLGMNPGPFGMVQTGVPFGEVAAVREWLKIEGPVGTPAREHLRRPVSGFTCARSEVSGRRLWGLFGERFGTPERFFAEQIVLNYCPLAFLESGGRNRTPDRLPVSEKAALFAACDRHLRAAVAILRPEWLVGIGAFAARRAASIFEQGQPRIGRIQHPSPASPAANRNWRDLATRQLQQLGAWD